ncbi:MAG: lysophospholipid acyltransferase family protein [Bacteroidales bacterium]
MKRVILDEEDLAEKSTIFCGRFGKVLARFTLVLFGVTRVNKVYGKLCDLEGIEFTKAWLKYTGVSYVVENEEVLDNLPTGAFITVSNHPFGGVDGVILVDLMARKRSDYKYMVNSILLHVRSLSNQFVGVKPTTPKSGSSVENTGGLKQTLSHIKSGGSMGFFPAGAVSGFYANRSHITEKEWQPTIIRLIQKANVPVIPIYIHGQNSWFFNFLGLIHWQLRTTRLAHEVLNKRGRVVRLTVGNPISIEEQSKYKRVEDLATFLRSKTEELGK